MGRPKSSVEYSLGRLRGGSGSLSTSYNYVAREQPALICEFFPTVLTGPVAIFATIFCSNLPSSTSCKCSFVA